MNDATLASFLAIIVQMSNGSMLGFNVFSILYDEGRIESLTINRSNYNRNPWLAFTLMYCNWMLSTSCEQSYVNLMFDNTLSAVPTTISLETPFRRGCLVLVPTRISLPKIASRLRDLEGPKVGMISSWLATGYPYPSTENEYNTGCSCRGKK